MIIKYVNMDRQTKEKISILEKAAKTWPSKASLGLKKHDAQLAKDFKEIQEHIETGIEMLKSPKYPNLRAESEFKAARDILKYRRNAEYDDQGYYEAIYEGRCTSNLYSRAKVKNCIGAVEKLLEITKQIEEEEDIRQYK